MLLRLLSSDWLKTKRTPVRWLTGAAILGYPALLLWYFARPARTAELPYEIHQAFFQSASIILPVGIGLLAGLLAAQEENAGHFNGLLGQSAPRTLIYLSKLLQLVMLVTVFLFGSMLVLLSGMRYLLHIEQPGIGIFMLSGLLALAGSLALCVLHLFLALAYGLGASVGAGGAGLLVAAIIGTTSIGDAIWPCVPWSWPARLAGLPALAMPGLTLPEGFTLSGFLRDQLFRGLVPACAVFMLAAVCSILWFCRWEGRKSYE
ncbi:lantibiotic immunity ABC transporter MutG family permease subunit [Paenibacillus sonchi]|uniref:lantibiotic immunity ABC transporter MutG family permease subunit n=1 Tax=Paenibacillus sonchi TaxID=373687 RepID=UPI0002F54186|nr:lantibiotic immunity ABC transporter MutG family permease subunit [Paenibacillus sonchi]MCE3200167.1 lantibiotic immunity ABC transporter MutG family permease subunit [Paenibacillus sonchi]